MLLGWPGGPVPLYLPLFLLKAYCSLVSVGSLVRQVRRYEGPWRNRYQVTQDLGQGLVKMQTNNSHHKHQQTLSEMQ